MLINQVRSSLLTQSIRYYALQINPKLVKKHYKIQLNEAIDIVQSTASQYQLDEVQTKKYFSYYPMAFKPETDENVFLRNRHEQIKQMKEKSGKDGFIGGLLWEMMFKCDRLAFTLKDEDLQRIINTIKDSQMTQSQIKNIFTVCPNLFNPKFNIILSEKLTILKYYLDMDQHQAYQLFEHSPFLLPCSTRRMKESLSYLLSTIHMPKLKVVELIKEFGEVLLIGKINLRKISGRFLQWQFPRQDLSDLFLNHPLLFLNDSPETMSRKIRILRYLEFTKEMAQKILRQFPQILIWSVHTLQINGIFIQERLKLKLNMKTLELMKYKHNKTLRPRGELLMREKYKFDEDSILELMRMPTEEFCEKLGITMEKYQYQEDKFKVTLEMDKRTRNILQNTNSWDKIVAMSEKYQS